MELECDLSKIYNEELLRKMWQQSEDTNRKKEIRSQLYKLRESRLRDLYQGDIMADNPLTGFGKDPLVTSYGDALADQSFQSLKSKEIRDSMSPTEMKFQSMTLNNPNTTGWNVQSSKEVSPDGRGYRTETLATTDGVESINGGKAEFKGHNQHLSSAHHKGDDKNFVKKAIESSDSHLQEKFVIGDENSGRTEVRTSSTKSSSSSQIIQSSTNTEYDEDFQIKKQPHSQKYIEDSNLLEQQHQQLEQQRLREEQRIYDQQFQQHRQQNLKQQEMLATEQVSTMRQNTQQKNISQNIQTEETLEQNKRYVDMDKTSPEYQQHVKHLMQQPGEIISNTVEYPKPNVKMITTVKRLPDGTIVRNKRYETEELRPTTSSSRPLSTATNPNQIKHDSQKPSTSYQPDASPHCRPSQDMLDNSSTSRYVLDTHTDDVEMKFSSIKKTSSKFSTQTTSKTVEEVDEHHRHGGSSYRRTPKSNDFSTHGFPSVKANKPTQEYPTERPQTGQHKQGYPSQSGTPTPGDASPSKYSDNPNNVTDFSTHGFPSVKTNKATQEYPTERPHTGHPQQGYPSQSDTPRPSDAPPSKYSDSCNNVNDFSTHGFPSVKANKPTQEYPTERPYKGQPQQGYPSQSGTPRPVDADFSTHGFPSVKANKPTQEYPTERPQTGQPKQGYPSQSGTRTPGDASPSKYSDNSNNATDFSIHGFPSVKTNKATQEYPTERPHTGHPQQGYTSQSGTPRPSDAPPSTYSDNCNNVNDFSTHGFPSVKDNKPTQEYPTERTHKGQPQQGYPSQSGTPRPGDTDFSTHGFPSVKANKPTQEYPTNRPHTGHRQPTYPSQSGTPRPCDDSPSEQEYRNEHPHTAHYAQGYNAPVPKCSDNTDNIIERRINTKDGEVIIVSSEKKSNFKTSTNSESIIETEHIFHDDQPFQQLPNKTFQDFSTQGFPSVREPDSHNAKNYSSENQLLPYEQGTGTPITINKHSPDCDDGVVLGSLKSHTAKHTERVVEHEIIMDGQQSAPYEKPNNNGYSTQGFISPKRPASGERTPYNEHPVGIPNRPNNDYESKVHTTIPAAGLPSSHNKHPSSPRKSPNQDYSTQGFPSVRSPSRVTLPQGYPSNVSEQTPKGTAEQQRANASNKIPYGTSSANKYKSPSTTVRETTERVIRKEKQVDSAHRAFAASLRSSSPIDHARRDSHATDSHYRHTPRSSVSSTKTFRRDIREGSNDSAPSETSRFSTTTITRNTPSRNAGGRSPITKLVTTKTGHGSNDSLHLTSPRATKSPSPGKIVTTTTTTVTKTLNSKDVPKASDNQHNRIITTKQIDSLFPINEPPLTSITKIKFSDKHKQPHTIHKDIRTKIMPAVTNSIESASPAELVEVVEAPCLKKRYYKVGPTDTPQLQFNTTMSHLSKSPKVSEKSPRQRQPSQPQQAPSSRISPPSHIRKSQTPLRGNDYDDETLSTSPFSPPSPRSKTPQKDIRNDNGDKDERRTVNRDTIFEKQEMATRTPRDQPNVEWVIIDDIEDYDYDKDHNDDNNMAPEVVDAKFGVKKPSTNLITEEKQTSAFPQRPKPLTTTTTTVTTKQFNKTPSKSQIKPIDKNALKTKPHDSRTSTLQHSRTNNKPLTTNVKSPIQSPSKLQPKFVENIPAIKGPKSSVPSNASHPIRKHLPKATISAETNLKKTLKTSRSTKEKSSKIVEAEKPKGKPQSPDRIIKVSNVVNETVVRRSPRSQTPQTDYDPNKFKQYHGLPYDKDDEPIEHAPNYEQPENSNSEKRKPLNKNDNEPQQILLSPKIPEDHQQGSLRFIKPEDEDKEPNYVTPVMLRPHDIDDKPRHKSPILRKPLSPGFQKLQSAFDQRTSQYRKPINVNDECNEQVTHVNDTPIERYMAEEITQRIHPDGQEAKLADKEPKKSTPGTKMPQDIEYVPCSDTPNYRMSQNIAESLQYVQHHNPRKIYEENIITKETSQEREPIIHASKESPQSAKDKPIKQNIRIGKKLYDKEPSETDEELSSLKPEFGSNETDDDEHVTDNESSIASSQKTVAKHIQKFETSHLSNKSPKPHIVGKSPTNNNLQKKILKASVEEIPPSRIQTNKQVIEKPRPVKSIKQSFPNTDDKLKTSTISEKPIHKEPLQAGSKSPERIVSPTRNVKQPIDHANRRPQSPKKHVSPSRIVVNADLKQPQNKRISPERTQKFIGDKIPVDDKTFTSSLRTLKVVQTTKPIDDDDSKRKPNELVSPKDNESFETTFTKNIVRKHVSQTTDNEKCQQTKRNTQSPTKDSTRKRPESPSKPLSPTRDHKLNRGHDSFQTSLRINEIVAEKPAKPVDENQYPDEETTHTKSINSIIKSKPKKEQFYSDELIKSEIDETFTESNFVNTKNYDLKENLVEEQESPSRESSTARTLNIPEHKLPKDVGILYQTVMTPHSPERSYEKPVNEHDNFTSSLKTTKIITEKTVTDEDNKRQCADTTTHCKQPDNLRSRPEGSKPYPTNENYQNFRTTNESFVNTKTCTVAEKLIHNNESLTNQLSSNRSPGIKEHNFLEDHALSQQIGMRSHSPTRMCDTSGNEDDNLKSSLKSIRLVPDKTTTDKDHDYKYPTKVDNDDEKLFTEMSDIFLSTGTSKVTDTLIQRPKSPLTKEPIKPIASNQTDTESHSPASTYKKSTTEDDNLTTTFKITKILTEEKSTGENSDREYPKKKTESHKKDDWLMAQPESGRPYSDKPFDNEDNGTAVSESSTNAHIVDKNIVEEFEEDMILYKGKSKMLKDMVEKPSETLDYKSECAFISTVQPDHQEIVVETSDSPVDLVPNISQILITKEKQTIESEKNTYYVDNPESSNALKDKKTCQSPKRSPSPNSTTLTNKSQGKEPFLMKPTDCDKEDSSTEAQNRYVTAKRDPFKVSEKQTYQTDKLYSSLETIEGQTYPEEEVFTITSKYLRNKQPSESFQFIETESARKETPDGAFISKTSESSTPTSPTFKKKGAGRSDTFEERCRQILGMESYGDTPGNYRKQPKSEVNSTNDVQMLPKTDITNTAVFHVKVEDCVDDDESFSINSVKKTLETEKKRNEQQTQSQNISFEHEENYMKDTRAIHKKSDENKFNYETAPSSSEQKAIDEKYFKETNNSGVKIIKKSVSISPTRSSSPPKTTSSSRSVSANKRFKTSAEDTQNRTPTKDRVELKSNRKCAQKVEDNKTTVKDRLRSPARKTTLSSKSDQVDISGSSPEHSPTRYTERRRSSNISVATEIIIEHTDSDTANKKETSPDFVKNPQSSVYKEIIDSTVMPEKLTRRMPVTERKESAPVHRVTNKDKDLQMSRSTSENLIKVTNSERHSSSPKIPNKTTDPRRPNKCFATKSINLSATDHFFNASERENVIIDIQHAKSSREPSPDKIIPTPVPAHMDTGKPRYPDVVQEPEDEQPKRKPLIKNVPIFEEENDSYVGCHITEINVEKSLSSKYDSLDYEEQILQNPVVEAPASLDWTTCEKPATYENPSPELEKVNEFQNLTEEISKAKSINKMKKKRDVDDKLIQYEDISSRAKLAPSAPQKSPELVRTISKHMSKQSEVDFNNVTNEDYSTTNDDYVECLIDNKQITKEFTMSHHETTTERSAKKGEKYQQQPQVYDDYYDDDELIPHTATHTTLIEERRQKDILSRPSVFDNSNKKPSSTTVQSATTTNSRVKCNKSPVKDSEKLQPDIKSRTKPTFAVTNTPTNNSTTISTTTTTSNKTKQSTIRKNSDIDYELRGTSNVETGVRNIISKQTKKVYSSNSNSNNNNSTSKTNDTKKLTTTSNKKPEKHMPMPVRLTPVQNADERDLSADDEMIVTLKQTTEIHTEPQVANEDLNKAKNTKNPSTVTTPPKRQTSTTLHSSTNSSPNDQPLKTQTKEHLIKLTDKYPLKSNTITTLTCNKSYETIERADDFDENLLEPSTKKSSSHNPVKINKMPTTTSADSVAARRNLFESNTETSSSHGAPHTKRAPSNSSMSGRKPSYMDHTRSSLEHTRRDSLEINKTNYSRKISQAEEEVASAERNSSVKFDVSNGKRSPAPRTISVTEDINVEDIFELDVLEKLIETVQSYEIRRRIRAQIRLIKINQKKELANSSIVTEVNMNAIKTSKVSSEEPDTSDTGKGKTTKEAQARDTAKNVSSSKKEYIFEEAFHPTTRRAPKTNRYPNEECKLSRSQSPQQGVPIRNTEHERYHSSDYQEQTEVVNKLKDDREQKQLHEITHETSSKRKSPSPSRKPYSGNSPSPSRKPYSGNSSPERYYSKSDAGTTTKKNERSCSPDAKTSPSNIKKSSVGQEQLLTKISSTSKPQTKRITITTTTTTTKLKSDDKTPVWADRKNILKAPGTTTPRKSSSSTTSDSRSGYLKTSKCTTSQKMTSNNKSSSFVDDDCITSSYGIGPTDENGLPLFGIRALKKKKSPAEPSETTEEVTGYVVEEKYYSDNNTKPTVERKGYIYSTNPEELQKLKEQVEVTSNRNTEKNVDLKESKRTALLPKTPLALRSSPEDDFLDSTSKYGRRGSVKEMSEKFLHKETSSTAMEKSNYPKAGLILRTNSRKNSQDVEKENDNFESYKTVRVQQHHTSTGLADSDGNQQDEYEVEEVSSRHSGRFVTESESECDSIKAQSEFKKVISSSSSSSKTSRSFLNSQGEEKVVTNISDCLQRMRNADNVVEEGDTAEDQEARALLNKFLGASIIMKGVESSLPATNRQSKIITATTTSCNLSDDDDGDNNANHEVITTRTTKTINSGSSSTPVTYTTCDIEEIWDEEILKELLEQATTYEERRKIRSRLRELMANREETKKSHKGDEKEAAAAANVPEDDTSASEYEEIIEEVTDYSGTESETNDHKENAKVVIGNRLEEKDKTSKAAETHTEEKSVIVRAKTEKIPTQQETQSEQLELTKTVINSETSQVEEYDEQSDSSEKGESFKPSAHAMLQNTLQIMPQENVSQQSNQQRNGHKFKCTEKSSNNKNKKSFSENSSMHPSSNYKTPKATSIAPTCNQNAVASECTSGKPDSTSISIRNNKNNINSTSSRPANCVTNNNDDSSSGSLGGNSVVVVSSVSPRQIERLGVPQKEDSGTESGEDLRLIAAGLRDQLQIQSDINIIEDVTCALIRLENSLKEGKDISVDIEKRKALLALVARLRAGLTSPEKLAEIAAAMSELDGNDGLYGETSSPEADAHRSNRSRFSKCRNRVNRHTVGVSREELADARRYMEDMLLMNNISQSTTPDANIMSNSIPPQWYPLEKNASTGSILTQPPTQALQRPKQFVAEENANVNYNNSKNRVSVNNSNKRRPLSGEYSVSFENHKPEEYKESAQEDNSKVSRFTNKKHLMKRANTIDLAKAHKYNPEFDTDSDADDKKSSLGLKGTVQVSVKKCVRNVVPPFEPKTENDRKFLAFINKQSDKPGLGWTTSRSVSNWTNKFGSIKNTFEGGLAGKPPQPPYHASVNSKMLQTNKVFSQSTPNNNASLQNSSYTTNQQIALRLQREAELIAEERKRNMEKERLEYERRERDKLERQRQQYERRERERLEREHFERQRREQDQITAVQHAAILREQEQLAAAQQSGFNMTSSHPIPINEFKHAPQSVFRPIECGGTPSKSIYKPTPLLPRNSTNCQSVKGVPARIQTHSLSANTRPDNSFITSPPPSTRSPIALPWVSKPTVDSSSFKYKAHRFEERSKYDNIYNTTLSIQRHNSLRSSNDSNNHMSPDYRKRPSLPNTADPYTFRQKFTSSHDPLVYLPPPQNISFTYSSLKPNTTYQSYPCLPLAVSTNSSNENEYHRFRDSLTDPHSVPLVLTSANPSYCPSSPASTQLQQQQVRQARLPKHFDFVSPANSTPNSPNLHVTQLADYTDDELDSDRNLMEYHAISRVMAKPQSQTAVTVGRRTGHVSDDELYGKNSRAAKNLLSTMKTLANSNSVAKQKVPVMKRSEGISSPKTCLSPDGLSYQAPSVDPLFPEMNKFESNRQPIYTEEPIKPTTTLRSQLGLYKSMENLNKSIPKNKSVFAQQSAPKPYVSETKTSYVVTYPVNDIVDDEDSRRLTQKNMMPPNSLDFKRDRHMSENSTGSTTTTSMSFTQNLPSPNTSWTSNPILLDESSNYQNTRKSYQNTITGSHTSTANTSHSGNNSEVTSSYPYLDKNYNSLPSDCGNAKTTPEYETQRQKEASVKLTTHPPATYTQSTTMPIIKTSCKDTFQKTSEQTINNKKLLPQQTPETHLKLTAAQTHTSSKTAAPTSTKQEEKASRSMRTTNDHLTKRGRGDTIINPKNSNISPEMLMRLDQQRERISNEARRKSLEHTLDYQMEKPSCGEAQNVNACKSSVQADTPDIVKSSLPKDESQPIVKKFGPPQRHHYMPNSYQSPSSNASSSVMTTIAYATKIQNKEKVSKSPKQIINNTKPTVIETPATPQPDDDYIPRNIVYNNVHAFSLMGRRQETENSSTSLEQYHNIRPSKLSKSDSWKQIMMLQSQHVANNTTRFSKSPTNELRRTKSGHTLALPKMFEATMSKTDINEKQKTVAAYFSGQKSPTQHETTVEQTQQKTKRSVINRTKTSEKVSAASRKSLGSNMPIVPAALQRSATMPHIANIHLLDESNVEDAFEQLIMEQKQQKTSSSTTEKTETKEKNGAVVTTTTKVTTRTITGSADKSATPFAKFKQRDVQNPLQSTKSPTTSKTTVGGSTASPLSGNQAIFKFTDPALNAKAATVKEQLLQWCQSKTQEYENIEITNFSTSWNNGLAFCALIHHFLPDAFDYSQLTPKNRRKNFELAFTVADEKAGIAPLLDVEDMVVMQRPDWKCVFVYVQSIYRRFRNCQ